MTSQDSQPLHGSGGTGIYPGFPVRPGRIPVRAERLCACGLVG